MPTTWSFHIDWTNDGDFSDSSEDVSARIISADWQLGMTRPYIDTADDSVLKLVLDNSDRRFSPEYGSGALWPNVKPFRKVRVQSNDGTTTRTHFTGWVETIQPDVNRYGQRRVTITAAGPMQLLKSTEANIDVQYNRRTDQVIYDLLRVPWLTPAADPDELLAEPPIPDALDTGLVTMDISADNWFSALSQKVVRRFRRRSKGKVFEVGQPVVTDKEAKFHLYKAIADVVAAERGRFFFQRDGTATFWNRHHLWFDPDPNKTVTLNETMVDMTYAYASDETSFSNDVRVTCHPRAAGEDTNTLLYKLEEPMEIPAGETRRIKVVYRKKEDGDARIGADEVTAQNVVFDKGTATITVKSKGDNAKIVIENTGSGTTILKKLELRGRTLEDFGQEEVTAEDADSIEAYGRHTLSMSLNSVESREKAQWIADYELYRRGTPRGMVTQVTVKSHGKNGGGVHAHQLARTIGDCVVLTETQTGQTNRRYAIVGEAHKLTDAATMLETTWYLEPIADTNTGWQLGVSGRSNLNNSTQLYF